MQIRAIPSPLGAATRHPSRIASRIAAAALLAVVLAHFGAEARAQRGAASESPVAMRKRLDAIMKDIEGLRGVKFEKPIEAVRQTKKDFEAYVDRELDRQMPGTRFEHYGKVVRILGLHNGPEITDFKGMARLLMTSQAAAYYDPETKKFYVLFSGMPSVMSGPLEAHELTHGMQDQRFDLNRYVMTQTENGLNDDELLARQSVVEGEASLIMTQWQMRSLTGQTPDATALGMVARMQADLSLDAIRQQSEQSIAIMQKELGSSPDGEAVADMRNAVKAMDALPSFMLEFMIGAYMKGMYFVNEIQRKQGWEGVDRLFTNPPSSSEQILHPEKYLAGENPVKIEWPAFEGDGSVFAGWRLLETNTLGEIGWRLVFQEQGLAREAKSAAAGWAGDSFAVLKREDSDDLILLNYTCWDTEADALEFSKLYAKVVESKYPEGDVPCDFAVLGRDVMMIEGVGETMIDGVREFVGRVVKK